MLRTVLLCAFIAVGLTYGSASADDEEARYALEARFDAIESRMLAIEMENKGLRRELREVKARKRIELDDTDGAGVAPATGGRGGGRRLSSSESSSPWTGGTISYDTDHFELKGGDVQVPDGNLSVAGSICGGVGGMTTLRDEPNTYAELWTGWTYNSEYSTAIMTEPDYGYIHGECDEEGCDDGLFGSGEVEQTFALPSHQIIKIDARLWFKDSWDGETIAIKVDGLTVWESTAYGGGADDDGVACSEGWTEWAGGTGCVDGYPVCYRDVSIDIPHTSDTVKVAFSTAFEPRSCSSLSWGFSEFKLRSTTQVCLENIVSLTYVLYERVNALGDTATTWPAFFAYRTGGQNDLGTDDPIDFKYECLCFDRPLTLDFLIPHTTHRHDR